MAMNKGAPELPDWLLEGMDPVSSYNLEIRIIADKARGIYYLNKVVDADVTNFKALVDGIVDKFPGSYGDVCSLFYFCVETKENIPVLSDHDLLDMFEKHKATKCCYLSLAYYDPSIEPPEIPPWEFASSTQCVETPLTPSLPCPDIPEPSQTHTESAPTDLDNPYQCNEHAGVDEEGLYIDLEPQHPPPTRTQTHFASTQREGEFSDGGISSESCDDYESDDDYEIEDLDDMVKDNEPDHMPDYDYDKKNPPMAVGSMYADMHSFKMALATHAVRKEFQYNIEKSDTGRYRIYCTARDDEDEPCKWRMHAAAMKDGKTIEVRVNPEPHTCESKRRKKGICKGVTYFWVCEQVIDWLKEDGTLGATELQRRLKEEFKITIPYMKVYNGKNLAMDKLYGPWDKSFDNLYRFKAQIESSSPDSFVIIDHHTINNKIRFNRLFFALKACVDGFLRGCRPYLAVDSTFLYGRFRGQLCIACAVDGHNWIYPVAVGVIDSETNENWVWFMEKLKEAIGSPPGITFSTDCGQAVMYGLSEVFPEAEHRECMYHLVQNFKKRYNGKAFDDNLWQASYAWSQYMFEKHYQAMATAKPESMKYLQGTHKKLWTRSQFGTDSKVDYVTNNLAESFNNWIKAEKGKHLDDLLDTIRQKLLIKSNNRKKVANKLEGMILPHIKKQLREDSFSLDIEVITEDSGVAEVCAKGKADGFRFVVDLKNRTCSCRVCQGTGIPCKHAIAYITSIDGKKLENHVDDFYSVQRFKEAYDGVIPSIPDKSMWPKATHGFFMEPPLLKSTAGRRKNRHKGTAEGGSRKKAKKHKCPICTELGHHWYTCKAGNPKDIAAMEKERGLPKKRLKKVVAANTETSIVVATRATGMVFPPNEAVDKAVLKKRKRKASSSSSGKKSKTSSASTSASTRRNASGRSGTGSNDPVPIAAVHLVPSRDHNLESTGSGTMVTVIQPAVQEQSELEGGSRKKFAVKKLLTPEKAKKLAPRRGVAETPPRGTTVNVDPSSPAANTRSKKLLLD